MQNVKNTKFLAFLRQLFAPEMIKIDSRRFLKHLGGKFVKSKIHKLRKNFKKRQEKN